MKRIYTLPIFLCILTLMVANEAKAQSIVGRWKRVSYIITGADGKQQNIDAMLRRTIPCSADYVYVFSADGTLKTDISACDAAQVKRVESMIEAMNRKSRWKQVGNKVIASTTDGSIPSSVHSVTFSGNTMTWQFSFANNPETPNPTNAKAMTFLYKRI